MNEIIKMVLMMAVFTAAGDWMLCARKFSEMLL